MLTIGTILCCCATCILGAVDLCCTLLQQSVYHLDKATVCRSSGLNQKQSTQYK